MNLNDLKSFKVEGKKRKRLGRGAGSGHGGTCCRGSNGSKSRSGNETGILFEGGQMPLYRRIPKRGFNNIFKKQYNVINLESLDIFSENEEIDINKLKEKGIIKKFKDGLKILGGGELKKALKIKADRFSESAIKKIKEAGGEPNLV